MESLIQDVRVSDHQPASWSPITPPHSPPDEPGNRCELSENLRSAARPVSLRVQWSPTFFHLTQSSWWVGRV